MTAGRTRIHLVAAARPNFMKVAPLFHALSAEPWCDPLIIHTGQHYDLNMSEVFLRDLGITGVHVNLGVGSGTHAQQTGQVMMAYERILLETPPEMTVVCGDVNSTIACALAAVKLGVPVAHLEAGLRSFDRTMPEEINRVLTDAIADMLWTPSPDADENLLREGVPAQKIQMVGNIMIDSLETMRPAIKRENMPARLGLPEKDFILVTLHRPSNVDDDDRLRRLVAILIRLAGSHPLVFPLHPRTRKRLQSLHLLEALSSSPGVAILEPLGYTAFLSLVTSCALMITDSGGVQEETSYLGIPCLTLRRNTERPVTISKGTNRLIEPEELEEAASGIGTNRRKTNIDKWDGRTSERIAELLRRRFA